MSKNVVRIDLSTLHNLLSSKPLSLFILVRVWFAKGPVTLYQNRTILHRRISSHRLHHGHTVVLGQPHGDSASSVAGNITMSTGFFSRALASMFVFLGFSYCLPVCFLNSLR